MTISATETSLTITGIEKPIKTIEIDGEIIDFTLYDGTLSSVTYGTPYTLTLTPDRDNPNWAFYGDSYADVSFDGLQPTFNASVSQSLPYGVNLDIALDSIKPTFSALVDVEKPSGIDMSLDLVAPTPVFSASITIGEITVTISPRTSVEFGNRSRVIYLP